MHLQQGFDWVDLARDTLSSGIALVFVLYLKNRNNPLELREYAKFTAAWLAAAVVVKILLHLRM
jgi:hypothetical protein